MPLHRRADIIASLRNGEFFWKGEVHGEGAVGRPGMEWWSIGVMDGWGKWRCFFATSLKVDWKVRRRIRMAFKTPSRKILRRALLAILPAFILIWTVTVILTINAFGSKDWLSYNGKNAPRKVDSILVLGAGVDHDRPSLVYEARLRHAVELFHTGVAPIVVFTGGLGSGDRLSEGEVGKNYAIAHGVPASAILLEGRSRTTLQNLSEAKREIECAGVGHNVALVSDPHHLLRASLIAKKLGLIPWPSPSPHTRYRSLKSKTPAVLREAYFLHHFAIFGE
jgi:uncharacterized SAM-binding protein YcdF (DUF218 family)